MTGPLRLPGGLTAVEVTAAAATPSHPPVLLLHGMMGGAWQFQWFQPVLAAAGYTSLALNYRGHHDSAPVTQLSRVSVRDYVRDALVACHHLGGRVIVVGQSMGGLIAQLLAERGAASAAVLIVSLPPRGVRWRSARRLRYGLRFLPAILRNQPLLPDPSEQSDRVLNGLPATDRAEFFARQVPESSRVAYQIALGLVGVDPAAVTCPVLSVTASNDRLVRPSVGSQLARRYGGDLVELRGPAHYALVGEPGWETAASMIIGWLDAVVSKNRTVT